MATGFNCLHGKAADDRKQNFCVDRVNARTPLISSYGYPAIRLTSIILFDLHPTLGVRRYAPSPNLDTGAGRTRIRPRVHLSSSLLPLNSARYIVICGATEHSGFIL